RIRIAFSREDDCQLIHIRNSGCTLSKNELPHIFDSFWRGSNTGSNNGSGLGLYICRTLMRKMNGDIFAEIQDEEMVVTTVFDIS
ncbi:MAG: sensor histidine kinase, partial [Ruminococcus sp.]|nr:sensor histidine kinase [Ruminococcus sp.]